MNEEGRWRGLGRFLVALYLFTVYLFICLHLGHTWRMVEDTGCLQSLSSLSFFLNLKRFTCFAFIHVCSDYMYVCTSCMYLVPVEVRRGYWSNSPASIIFREAEWPASSQDPLSLPPSVSHGATGTWDHTLLLLECWGFELRSLYLHYKFSYPLSGLHSQSMNSYTKSIFWSVSFQPDWWQKNYSHLPEISSD